MKGRRVWIGFVGRLLAVYEIRLGVQVTGY